ncbi:hypothetical protein KRR40_12990 [Niabella defluvii]|nr:hypothetical protein KRR40_12990 [Niabella sp. I65]
MTDQERYLLHLYQYLDSQVMNIEKTIREMNRIGDSVKATGATQAFVDKYESKAVPVFERFARLDFTKR